MTTPEEQDKLALALPPHTPVTISTLDGVHQIAAARVQKSYLEYSVTGVIDDQGRPRWFRSWNVRAAQPVDTSPAVEAAPPTVTKREHTLTTDDMVPESERPAKKTPAGLRKLFEDGRREKFGSEPQPTVTPPAYRTDATHTAFAQIVTDVPEMTEQGITVGVTVLCNPQHMAKPHDLVPVTLETTGDRTVDSIAVLEPGKDGNGNVCELSVSYTYGQLVKLLGLSPPPGTAEGAALRDWFIRTVPQLGIKAEWLTAQEGGTNGPNHFSGGVKGKGGSGKIKFRALTDEELRRAEKYALSDWNIGERLREDRPVYVRHLDVLQPGKEMATNIEAEAEYIVTKEEHDTALDRMRALAGNAKLLQQFGIVELKAQDDKRTVDSYFDTEDKDLLRRMIVLRRRHVSTDAPGTYLFSVKGRSVVLRQERFRLTAQVHLRVPPTDARVGVFCGDHTTTDNAFARVLHDALTTATPATAWNKVWHLQDTLTVTSDRVRYSIQLEHGTTVEFSADTATAEHGDRTATQYCVELGVGHPGLFVSDAVSSGTAAGIRTWLRDSLPYVRPYHVPTDLDNPALVNKPDFQQFADLRQTLVKYLFGQRPSEMRQGGNKAHSLAGQLGIIPAD